MSSSHRPDSFRHASGQYLIIQIKKSTAIFLLLGMAVIAAIFVGIMRHDMGGGSVSSDTALASIAETSAAAGAASTVNNAPPQESATATASETATEPPDDSSGSTATVAEPATAAAPVTAGPQTIVKFYPSAPLTGNPPQADPASPQPSPSDQRADSPQPSSDPGAASPPTSTDIDGREIVNGAGVNLPYPLYTKWFEEYSKVRPAVTFNYQSIGGGAAIKQLLQKRIDFGATDFPMTELQADAAKRSLVRVPSVVGGVVTIYNLEGVELRFTPELLAGIYLGQILYWNDRRIAEVNPRAALPAAPIVVVHRSDGCGATYTLSDYLSKVSYDWQQTLGKGASLNWLIGVAAKGDEGIADVVKRTEGSIGYLDYVYAVQNRITFANVLNQAHKFVKADAASLTAAAVPIGNEPLEFRDSITNAPSPDAYPIASFTSFLAPMHSRSLNEAHDLREFLHWMLQSGAQSEAAKLGYAPLPEELAARVTQQIWRIQ